MSVTPPPESRPKPHSTKPPGTALADSSPASGKSRALVWVGIFAALLAGGAGFKYYRARSAASAETPVKGGRGTPVSTAVVKSGELRVYLDALGTVTPVTTSLVRSRVEGELLALHFEEGQTVQAGDLLAEIDPRGYEVALLQTQGQLARDTALLNNAKLDLDRYRSAKDAITQQQLATAETLVEQLSGVVKSDQGLVDAGKLQLSYCRILAPITGRVGLKLVDNGNIIRASDSTGVALIIQERPITVLFSLPEENVPALRKSVSSGHPLVVQAFDRSGKTAIATGKVAALDNQIDPSTGTVRLKAVFANDDDALFPNQFVNVRVLLQVQPKVLLVPTSAIQISNQARYVFALDDSGQAVSRRAIHVGQSEGDLVSVMDGLKEGETIVTDGLDKLQDGSKVSARDPKAAAGPGEGRPKSERKKKSAEPAAP